MEKWLRVIASEVLLDSIANVDCVEGNDQINVLFCFSNEQTLVQVDQGLSLLEVGPLRVRHGLADVDIVLVVHRKQKHWSFWTGVLQEVAQHLVAERWEPGVRVNSELESLQLVSPFQLEPQGVFDLVFPRAFYAPQLSPFVEEYEVLLGYVLVRNEKLVHLPWHLRLQEVGEESDFLVEFVPVVKLLWIKFLHRIKLFSVFFVFFVMLFFL